MPIKVFLIMLSRPNPNVVHEPLGIECLGGYLKKYFKQKVVISYDYCRSLDDINQARQKINKFQPDILGISLFFNSLSLLDELINVPFPYTLVLGNVLATFNSSLLLKKYPQAIICQGSGEEALKLLVEKEINKQISLKDIPNIIYQSKNTIFHNPRQISPIGKPDRFMHKTKLSLDISYLEFSRGCEYNCTFCLQKKFFSHGRTCKPMSAIVREIIELVKYGTKKLYFIDEDFIGPNPNKIIVFAKKIIELKNKGVLPRELSLDFPVSVKSIYSQNASKTDQELKLFALKKLRQAGWNKCFIGLESGSKTQLNRYGKAHTIEESIKAIKILNQLKIDFQAGFIMFDPLVTLDEIRDNVEFCFRQKIINSIGYPLHQLRVYPQSAIYHLMSRHNLIRESDYDPNWLSVGCSYLHSNSLRLFSAIKKFDSNLINAHIMAKNVIRSAIFSTLPKNDQQYYQNFLQQINQSYFDSLRHLVTSFQQESNINLNTRLVHARIADCLISLLNQGDHLSTVWQYSPELRNTLVNLIFKKRIISLKKRQAYTYSTIFCQKYGLSNEEITTQINNYIQVGEIKFYKSKYYLTEKFFNEPFYLPDDKIPVCLKNSPNS